MKLIVEIKSHFNKKDTAWRMFFAADIAADEHNVIIGNIVHYVGRGLVAHLEHLSILHFKVKLN
jgi:hypothetical protein